ncbi:MAG: CRP-like cAMP-binding protein [Gammaproteobacteria bacterium]|jgi:CRP-like cAMP-binding protein
MNQNTRLADRSAPAEETGQSLFAISSLLQSRAGSINFMAGSRIFAQGESGDLAHMIDSGYVKVSSVTTTTKNVLATLEPGEIFGEITLIDGQPRSATATALHETTVISISRTQLRGEVDRKSQSNNTSSRVSALSTTLKAEQADAEFETARLAAADQVRLRFKLEQAISAEQFELACQPIVSLADGRTSGFEALLR